MCNYLHFIKRDTEGGQCQRCDWGPRTTVPSLRAPVLDKVTTSLLKKEEEVGALLVGLQDALERIHSQLRENPPNRDSS